MTLTTCIDTFLQDGRYTRDWKANTIRTYEASLGAFIASTGDIPAAELSKLHLNNFVIGLRQRGLKPGGVNVRLRTMNSFLSWLYEQQLR